MKNEPWDVYRKQGYYQAKNLLPISVVSQFVMDLNTIISQQLSHFKLSIEKGDDSSVLFSNMKQLFAHQQTAYLASLRLGAKLFSLQSLMMHPEILDITQKLGIALAAFQTTPVLHVMSPALKIPEGYYGFGVHQDWTALQSGLDTLTTWVPFVSVDKNCYPLQLIPGSHLQGLLPGKQGDHIVEVDARYYDEDAFISIEAEPGDVIFMSNFTVHRSGQQGDARLRLAASTRYENASEATFIERMYPYTQKRTIDRTVLFPDFPRAHQVKNIFVR